MPDLLVATVGISVIRNYLTNQKLDMNSILRAYRSRNINDEDDISDAEETAANIAQYMIDNIDVNEISAEVHSVALFKAMIQREGRQFGLFNIKLLHTDTYEGLVAALANKQIIINKFGVQEENIEIRKIPELKIYDQAISGQIGEELTRQGLENYQEIINQLGQGRGYERRYMLVSGGYKIQAVFGAIAAYSNNFVRTFLNHEDSNFLLDVY